MAKSVRISVTPNLKTCLAELKKAAASLPSGEAKKRAESALAYLERTFRGKPQPLGGRRCPVDTAIIKV